MYLNRDEMKYECLFCGLWQNKMKVTACLIIALFYLAAGNAKRVKVVGEIENHKFIDQKRVYAEAEHSDYRNDIISKIYIFPEVSPNTLTI